MTPILSVCIPIYKVEAYIKQCLISLFSQTIADKAEFILVNDCTPDSSMHIAQEVIDSYPSLKDQIHIIHHEKNSGLAAARKTGILHAKGSYIIHVDSDDYVEAQFLEKIYEKALSTKADIVVCEYYEEHTARHKRIRCTYTLPHQKEECFSSLLTDKICWAIWVKLVKREVYSKYDAFWIEGLNLGEDMLASVCLFHYAHSIVSLPLPLYHYRIDNPTNLSHARTAQSNAQLYSVLMHIKDFLIQKNIYHTYESEYAHLFCKKIFNIIQHSTFKHRRFYYRDFAQIDDAVIDTVIQGRHTKRIAWYIKNRQFIAADILLCIKKIKCTLTKEPL